ncbi:exported hypothetical protein [Verrucomicrobia bacterium]|nr:exported hypothetical protein [Verrucomicrobiota bacterium]
MVAVVGVVGVAVAAVVEAGAAAVIGTVVKRNLY